MTQIRDELPQIDRLIHEPARLAILTTLSACKSADFLYIQRLIGLTPGNLSSHLSKLEEAGMLWIDKKIRNKRTYTRVGLTEPGRTAIERHWRQLENLRSQAAAGGTSGSEGSEKESSGGES
jgi:DNA-binding MarR family transcriptional regulator